MSGINNRLKTAEEKFNDLGYILIKTMQAKIHREKKPKRKWNILMVYVEEEMATHSSILA